MNDITPMATTPTSKRSDVAGRHTPLIKNQWYVAARSEEVTRTPLRRTILEQDIVLYRKQDGTPVGLQNRCAHRSYPLHLGHLNGDRIVCGYHGFEYGADGKCALAPALGMAVEAIRIQPYPVEEIGPFIWIWTGDPAAVDYDKLVKQPWFTSDEWRYRSGYFHMKANYLGMHENRIELSHFPFLHAYAREQPALAQHRLECKAEADRVTNTIEMENFPVTPEARKECQFDGPVHMHSLGIVETPAMSYGAVTFSDASTPPHVGLKYIVHLMTPETQETTHYYWGVSRNFGLDDPKQDKEVDDFANATYYEDVVGLEAVEELIRRDNRPDFRERIIASDKAGILVMRLLARMAQEEAAEAPRAVSA